MLKGKTAIVTGGTRGIGYAIVKKFLDNGANVALFGSRLETVDKALQALQEENPAYPVMGLCPDLTDSDAVAAAFAQVKDKFGSLDILANNAGVSSSTPLCDYKPGEFEKIMNLNVTAVYICCQAAARIMKEQGGFQICRKRLDPFLGQRAWQGSDPRQCRRARDHQDRYGGGPA